MRRQRPIRSIDFSGLPQARRWHIRRKGAPERLPDHLPLIKRRRVFIDGDEGSAPGAIQSMTTLASTTAMTAHLRQRLHHGVEVAPSVSYSILGIRLRRIEVHPDRQQRGTQLLGSPGNAGIDGLEAPDGFVVRHKLRGASAPCSLDLDLYLRIPDQVLNVCCRPPMMGNDPQHIAVESIAHGYSASLAGPASDRFEKSAWISGVAGAQQPSRIDQTYLHESHQPPLHWAYAVESSLGATRILGKSRHSARGRSGMTGSRAPGLTARGKVVAPAGFEATPTNPRIMLC